MSEVQYIMSGVAKVVDLDGQHWTFGSRLLLVNKVLSVAPVLFTQGFGYSTLL
uniref:ABC transporter ATP-binding protein n=1 Tax=Mesocestoides corti TaxID=53468 RepID=A0A5K3FD76_MESCO